MPTIRKLEEKELLRSKPYGITPFLFLVICIESESMV